MWSVSFDNDTAMTTAAAFTFRSTLVDERTGAAVYEFPARFASKAWARILADRSDPYETVSLRIGAAQLPNGAHAHIARVSDLYAQTLTHMGTANLREDTVVRVEIHPSTYDAEASMKLLTQPRVFRFSLPDADEGVSKIVLSHHPNAVQAVLWIGSPAESSSPPARYGPVPLDQLRTALAACRQRSTIAPGMFVTVELVDPYKAAAVAAQAPALPPSSRHLEKPATLVFDTPQPQQPQQPQSPRIPQPPPSKMYSTQADWARAERPPLAMDDAAKAARRKHQPPSGIHQPETSFGGAGSLYTGDFGATQFGAVPGTGGPLPGGGPAQGAASATLPVDFFATS